MTLNYQPAKPKPETALVEIDTAPMIASLYDFRAKVDKMANEAMGLIVDSDETMARAVEMSGQARKVRNAIEKRRKIIIEPLLTAQRRVNDAVKIIANQLDQISTMMDRDQIRPYALKIEAERKEAERKARQEAQRLEAERRKREAQENKKLEQLQKEAALSGETLVETGRYVEPVVMPEVVVPHETKIKTTSGSAKVEYVYVAHLEDPRNISDACIKARWAQLEAALMPHARAMVKAGIYDIPGFRVVKEAKVKTRSK